MARSFVSRFTIAAVAVAALGGLLSLPTSRAVIALALAGAPRSLVMPVVGVSREALAESRQEQLERAGHRALDIFCVRGAAVVAPARGLVLSVGAHSVRLIGPGAQLHFLSNVTPRAGLEPGARVEAGDPLGVVGDPSGDERGLTPHLHYGLSSLVGRAVDPYPALAEAGGGG